MEVVGYLGGGHAQSEWYRANLADFGIPLTYSDTELLEYLEGNAPPSGAYEYAPAQAMY